jgi:Amt family ammonium transporter
MEALGGLGGVSLMSQIIGTIVGCGFAALAGAVVYGGLKKSLGIRLTEDEERQGADLSIHKIAANPETGIR